MIQAPQFGSLNHCSLICATNNWVQDLALQLQFFREMGFARVGLMSPAPGRPCEDAGVGDTPLG